MVPISLIVLVMVLLPAFLYPILPEGPVKEGDRVFSTGRHRAYFADPRRYHQVGYQSYCVVEPRDPLVIVGYAPDQAFLARVQGKTKIEFPFCPPQAEVILKRHQVAKKESLWSQIRYGLARIVEP